MTYIPYIEGPFFDAVERGDDYASVERELLKLTTPLGVDAVSCVDVRPPIGSDTGVGCLLGKQDTEYVTRYRQEKLADRDVTIMRVFRTRKSFSWEDAKPLADSTARKEVFSIASEHGYRDGWIVPHHGQGMRVGVTSFMGEKMCDRPGTRRLLTHIGNEFYAYARQKALEGGQVKDDDAPPHLTRRQLELCYMIAAGMTDKQMALKLDIAVKTVNNHMEILRKKFQASTRTELLAKVMFLSYSGQLLS